ncbi:uncharacterized protein LOC21394002 [Morus notabilis]|uniref:uncharacterized protein LOC21394002 n=1 Tax=Morus notabilis TaxID=981085 RepID=UPI000CED7B5B|nr:uncharacterized protein LOC21394002 [Morus notabilis]
MASRFRSLSKPTLSLLNSAISRPARPMSSLSPIRSSQGKSVHQLGCVESLLPLHTAVSSARLTSCLGVDSRSSRSLSQELGLSVPR